MPKFTQQQSAVMTASKNRMQLRRQFGLSFQCVEVVLKLAHMQAFGRPRATQSDVARALGINRSRVCAHLKMAAAATLLVRVGRTYIFRLKTVRSMCEQAEIARRVAALKREFVRKTREIKESLGFVADCATHTIQETLDRSWLSIPDTRQAALAELARTYVPVHLRKSHGG